MLRDPNLHGPGYDYSTDPYDLYDMPEVPAAPIDFDPKGPSSDTSDLEGRVLGATPPTPVTKEDLGETFQDRVKNLYDSLFGEDTEVEGEPDVEPEPDAEPEPEPEAEPEQEPVLGDEPITDVPDPWEDYVPPEVEGEEDTGEEPSVNTPVDLNRLIQDIRKNRSNWTWTQLNEAFEAYREMYKEVYGGEAPDLWEIFKGEDQTVIDDMDAYLKQIIDILGRGDGKYEWEEPDPIEGQGEASRRWRDFIDMLIAGNVPMTGEQKRQYDVLYQGATEGLTQEERAGRKRTAERAVREAQSRAAFKGIGWASKTFGEQARILADSAAMTAGLSEERKERYSDKLVQFEEAREAGNQAKAGILLAEAEQERLREEMDRDTDYANRVFELEKLKTLHNMDLQDQQITLAKQLQAWNMAMGERQFTADQEQAMIDNGFTQQQIDNVRQDMEMKYDLAEKNWGLAERAQTLDELENSQGYGLEERMVALKEELGIRSADLEDARFRHYRETIEKEFGIRLRDQELREFIETGRLQMDVIDMGWRNTIAERQEMHNWMLGTEGLRVQELLGMSQIEANLIIQGEWISVEREAQMLAHYMHDSQLDFDYTELRAQIEESRKDRSASILTSFLGGLSGIAGGIGGLFGGGGEGRTDWD